MSKIYADTRGSQPKPRDAQKVTLEAAGCDVVMLETASGASREGRPSCSCCRRFGPGDVLIVTKLDRLARDTVDMLELDQEIGNKKAGMKFLAESWADTTTLAGILILTVMAGVAAFERAWIGERQREGIEAAKKAGKYTGDVIRFDTAKIRELVGQAGGDRAADGLRS